MNKKPEHSGCWYCMTDFDSPLGWYDSQEFDCVLHVECLEYEFNENCESKCYRDGIQELEIFLKEFRYELI
jgi:hypothetical protein